LKDSGYDRKLVKWYKKIIFKLFTDQKMAKTAAGIPLQICDIFVQEMNKVDANASLENLAELLEPFLKSLAAIQNKEVQERISNNIFKPLLENNKTVQDDSDDEEWMQK
jgi:phage terminase large subunit